MKLRIEFANGGNITVDGPHKDWEALIRDVTAGGWLAIGDEALVNLDNVTHIVVEKEGA